tara:strand:- start:6916 stop:7176 length:261 start_codon:yes stop_codon:yes gene_type:complete
MNKYIIEFLGTLFFVYTILATKRAIPIGLSLMVAIILGGSISGGNYNPVVSIIMNAIGVLPSHDLFPYIACQLAGGLVALELYKRV